MNKRIKKSAVKTYSFVKNVIQSKNNGNLNYNQKTAGKWIHLVFFVKSESLFRLLFFAGPARFYFIKLRSQNIHFRLAFNGFLGKREKYQFH